MKRLGLIIAALLLVPAPAAAERKALILFVQFQDLKFSSSYEQFSSMADSLGIYFNDQFHGSQVFSFTRGPVITIAENHAVYGANGTSGSDVQMYRAVIQACQAATDSLNLKEFINPPSAELRDLLIMVPGRSETDSLDTELFRPQFTAITGGNPYAGGCRIACYGLACELDAGGSFNGIGTMAHEYCHILGLSDLYDTDGNGSGGMSKALWGSLSIMDGGNGNGGGHYPPNFSAAEHYTLGTGKGEKIDTAGTYTLEPIGEQGRYFIFEGQRKGEVFLAESRIERGWDTLIGGHGMVIYHYDRSSGDALWSDWEGRTLTAAERWEKNRVNCNPAHQCVQLEAPDTLSAFFPHGAADGFASETSPAFRYWDGSISPLAISGISQAPDGTVSFKLSRPISSIRVTPYQNSVTVGWKCDPEIAGIDSCKVVCTKGADTLAVKMGALAEDGIWNCTVEKLSPATTYRVTIHIMKGGSPFFSAGTSASTLPSRRGSFPFIYLKGAERHTDGSFVSGTRIPLQVFNAPKAVETVWYFNGSMIEAGPDGLFTIPGSGTLRAEILREDGSRDCIVKEITVR